MTIQCLATYNSSINVPAHLTFEEALQYAQYHINEIPIVGELEYVPDSDKLDVENCDFEE